MEASMQILSQKILTLFRKGLQQMIVLAVGMELDGYRYS
jgi:hypothetical protein